MIASLLSTFGPWIVGIGALVLAFFGVKTSMNKAAKAEGRATAAETIAKDREAIAADQIAKSQAANNQQTKAVENANETRNDVGKLPSGAAADELRDKWSRD
jgi:hypothetical protein